MKFGIFDHLDYRGFALDDQYDDRLSLIAAYDRAGLHGYFVAEHHSTPLGMAPAPSVFLAAVAQRTERLRFGPMVYTLNLHHPLRLIEEICMLDHMSRGRLEIGLGRGISPAEMRFFGGNPADTPAMYEEALAVLRMGLTSRVLDFAGKFYDFREVPIVMEPKQRPHPPFWLAMAKPESAVLAAREGAHIATNQPLDQTRAITDRFRAEWAALGKDKAALPNMGVTRHMVIASTDREAMAIARRGYLLWFDAFMHHQRKHGYRAANLSYPDNFDDMMAAGNAVAGSPATVRDVLARHIAETGINYLFCRLAFGDIALAESLNSLELLTREVIPALTQD